MIPAPRSPALRILALAGMAAAAALVSNTLASPARRLAWASSGPSLPAPTPQPEKPTHPEPVPPQPTVQAPKEDRPIRPAPQKATRVTTPATPSPQEAPSQAAISPMREISSQEAWKAFQAGVPFLDARRSVEFTEGHIAGAWCTPVWESDLDDRLIAFKATRRPGPEDSIVIYCSGGDCRDSHLLAAKLLNEGYFHLLIYRDGFPAWVAQGHPVEKGQP